METGRWTAERANDWYAGLPWLAGCNFIPSTAVNQLEMWQAETFDPATIERELGWAQDLGFNLVRVYLHDLPWAQEPAGFAGRIGQYLDIAAGRGMRTLFVLFDDCWRDDPRAGAQPAPIPGIHNSGWVKSPGTRAVRDRAQWGRLEAYVRGVLERFGEDGRVLMWDLYNEPGNSFLPALNLPALPRAAALLGQLARTLLLPQPSAGLLEAVFGWARAAQPRQPLTAALWYLRPRLGARLNPLALALSDVLSFHSYFPIHQTMQLAAELQAQGRPVFCSEYLARRAGCTFETHMPYFKAERIACCNWGLVSGKTQTMYAWQEQCPAGQEPPLWFHDILRPDGSAYRQEEADLIRRVTGKA